jgi:hypothetical protein
MVTDEMLGDDDAEPEVANYDLDGGRGRKNERFEVAPVRLKPSITTKTKKVLNLTQEGANLTLERYDPIAESRRAKAEYLANPPIECEHGRVAIICQRCIESKVNPNND